ncbi:MAG: Hemerythrin cation binding domain protein [Gammaproteobacteria bacterium]|jgi:hypothetical protein|nr:Hemerythrin cation binding domain protein [Gammaproteobacteria bacterium]
MNIYTYLKKDHQKVKQLFKKIILAKTSKERENYFLEIRKELELHATSEDATFYKAIKINSKNNKIVEHAEEEHAEIKKLLSKLSKISSKETAIWLVKCGELKYAVEHHVKEEESKIFEKSKEVLSEEEAEKLAVKIKELKSNMAKSSLFQKKFKKLKK